MIGSEYKLIKRYRYPPSISSPSPQSPFLSHRVTNLLRLVESLRLTNDDNASMNEHEKSPYLDETALAVRKIRDYHTHLWRNSTMH